MKLKSIASAAAALLCPLAVWASPMLTISPATQTVPQGSSATVTVGISGLTAASQIVSGFTLDLVYDSSILTYAGNAFLAQAELGGTDPVLGDNWVYVAGPLGAAGFTATSFSWLADPDLMPLQGDAFNLFSVTFTAKNVDGWSNVNFGARAGVSPIVTGILNPNTGEVTTLQLGLNGACVAVGTGVCGQQPPVGVPEPATYGLAAIALLAAGLAGRSRRRSGTIAAAA